MSQRGELAAEAAMAAKRRVDTKLGAIWWAVLLRGLLALGLAVCAFVWPERTLGIFVKLLGAYFLIDGVIGAIGAYRSGDRASPLIQTIVSLAIGLVLLFWTGISAKLFLVLVGVWLALQGISLFLAAFRMAHAEEERTPTMAIGAVMVLVGAVFVLWTDTGGGRNILADRNRGARDGRSADLSGHTRQTLAGEDQQHRRARLRDGGDRLTDLAQPV